MVAGKPVCLLAGLWLALIVLALGGFVCLALIAVVAAGAFAAITTWAVKRATCGSRVVYRILMRVSTALLVIALLGLALAIAMSPGPIHLHTDPVGLTLVFGPTALVAELAWKFRTRPRK